MPEQLDAFAVIGAGPVGLGVARALKEHDVPYQQFEADGEIGGNWYHGVYATTHTISSRKVTQYPEYPMPSDYPDYPSRDQMLAYLRDYADHFGLIGNISFNSKVVMARPRPDERWEVTLASGESFVFKGLIVCNGHDWNRRFPEYPGTFTGELIHSKDYKRPEQLAGKRVLVIGAGNSACDIASEAARVGASSDLSLRRGYWFVPKVLFGKPFHEAFPLWTPIWLHRLLLRLVLKIAVGDYRTYGLPRPDHKIFECNPTFNSELLHYLRHGRITPHPAVERLDGKTVHFVDGISGTYDIVVCATGFHLTFPFLPPQVLPVKNGLAPLYGGFLPADYKHLYVGAAIHPIYGFGPPISAGADLTARMIKIQDRMELPIGRVLKELGKKLPRTHLVTPGAALREMRRAGWLLPLLPMIERRLRRRIARAKMQDVALEPLAWFDPDVTVY
jgi:flavin-binding monooxygenase-like protein